MKKLAIGVVAVVALIGTPVLAADLNKPVYKAPPPAPPPVPVFSWTGFYVGATAGAAWSKADVTLNTVNGSPPLYDPPVIPVLDALGSPSISSTNAILGGKLGYNWQSNWLFLGIEGDFSYFRVSQSALTSGNPFAVDGCTTADGCFGNFNATVKTDWLATIRPRIGYALDRVLFYATAT